MESYLIYLSYLVNVVVVIGWMWQAIKKLRSKRYLHSFFGNGLVKIYLPVRDIGNRKMLANEDFFSGVTISQFLASHNIKSMFKEIDESQNIEPNSNSIIICGPKSNKYVHDVISYDPNFKFQEIDSNWTVVDAINNYPIISPMDMEPPQDRDIAYLNRFKRGEYNIIIIAGIHAKGSMGAIDFITNQKKLKTIYKEVTRYNFSTLIISKFNHDNSLIEDSSLFTTVRSY